MMKHVILAAFFIALALAVGATYHAAHYSSTQRAANLSSGSITVVGDTDRDLGNISLGDSSIISYTLRNTGDVDVMILNVRPSCGCTAAVLDTNIVSPGCSSHIRAIFNTKGKGVGNFYKTISVTTNSIIKPTFRLGFHGILKMPENPHSGTEMHLNGIFEGNCASCHSMRGSGELGEALWKADCMICHTGAESTSPPSIDDPKINNLTPGKFERIVCDGIRDKNMPAFGLKNHGPLTDQQVTSLREFIEWRTNHKL